MQDTYEIETVYCIDHGTLVKTSRPYNSDIPAAEYFAFKAQQGRDKTAVPIKGRSAHIVKVMMLLQSSEQLEDRKVVEQKTFQCLHHREPV